MFSPSLICDVDRSPVLAPALIGTQAPELRQPHHHAPTELQRTELLARDHPAQPDFIGAECRNGFRHRE